MFFWICLILSFQRGVTVLYLKKLIICLFFVQALWVPVICGTSKHVTKKLLVQQLIFSTRTTSGKCTKKMKHFCKITSPYLFQINSTFLMEIFFQSSIMTSKIYWSVIWTVISKCLKTIWNSCALFYLNWKKGISWLLFNFVLSTRNNCLINICDQYLHDLKSVLNDDLSEDYINPVVCINLKYIL